MVSHEYEGQGQEFLEVSLEVDLVYVSSLSSLLRVVQVALREATNYSEGTRAYFERHPQPRLVLSRISNDKHLTLRFSFADPDTSASVRDLSLEACKTFMSHFIQRLKEQPQPSLWGLSLRVPRPKEYASELDRRVDQVRVELRRFEKATVVFGGQRVQIDGDRIEIEEAG